MRKDLKRLLDYGLDAARAASAEILKIYATSNFDVAVKHDGTPVTNADLLANAAIQKILQVADVPILSEEATVPFDQRREWHQFWLVDPLDGTKDFIARTDEFTVNIAFIEGGVPVIGVVAAPALQKIWYATQGGGAWLISADEKELQINAHAAWPVESRMFTSRFHDAPDALEFRYLNGIGSCIPAGAATKLVRIAASEAEFYPRFAGTSEWDIAAGDVILREAGGMIRAISGERIQYNTPSMRNPFFVAWRPPMRWEGIKLSAPNKI